jgi:hypothetical protein
MPTLRDQRPGALLHPSLYVCYPRYPLATGAMKRFSGLCHTLYNVALQHVPLFTAS